MSSTAPATVRLRDPGDLAVAVPQLLGFVPSESVVALSLRGRRSRLGLTLRADLVDVRHDAAVADMLAMRMAHDGAAKVAVVIYTGGADGGARLPRHDLVEAIEVALSVPLLDALLVREGRWWSYLCSGVGCCPDDGRPLEPASTGAATLAAVHALQGRAVLPDRDAVVASLAPVPGVAAVSMRQATDRAAAGHAALGQRFVDDARDLLLSLLVRYSEPPARLTDDEAACVIVAAHDVGLRDELLRWTAQRHDPLHGLLRDVVRRAQPPLDAPVCSVLAWLAYSDGDGLVAATALDRALASDPSYSLARLLAEALAGQVHPRALKRVLAEHLWRGR